jgi:hypothetical protein
LWHADRRALAAHISKTDRIATRRAFNNPAPVNDGPENYEVPTWKFVVAVVVMITVIGLATLFWMWRDSKPRRRPPLLGAPEPALVVTNRAPVPAP